MRGVLTLAGEGTRMLPWTRGLRKEFLPLYDRGHNGAAVLKPVAHIVLETLIDAGVNDVTLVVGAKDLAFVQNYFTVDREFLDRHAHHAERLTETRRFYATLGRLRLRFAVQPSPKGFGDAVLQAEPYVAPEPFFLHAADALLLEPHRGRLLRAMGEMMIRDGLDAVLLVRRVADPARYGVVEVAADGKEGRLTRLRVKGMEEKPKQPKSTWAATAAYAFSPRMFAALKAIARETHPVELEVTDAVRRLIADGAGVAALVLTPTSGEWLSVGSPEGFVRALKRTQRLAHARSSPAK
ncbi:MAG: sugar phosphate nucleotidyltransferase [Thermoplasmata archaeon]